VDPADDPGARRRHTPGEASASPRGLAVIQPFGLGAWESQVALPPSPQTASDQLVVGDIPREAPGFQPRPDLLATLERAGRGVQVLSGTPGAGGSQLAAAYARAKLAAGWPLVAWINAASTGTLLAGLGAVADAAELSDGDSGPDAVDAGQLVREWLETDGDRCLLVFDDAEDPDVLRPFVPVGAAHVLITGGGRLATLGASVPVDVFRSDEALAYLARRTGLADAEAAAAVAAELGHLPLALAQAAAVIDRHRLAYGAYLGRLRALPVPEHPAQEAGEALPPGAAAAVELSLQAVDLADRTGVSIRVMEILAVLSAAGVRRELLHLAGKAGLLTIGRRLAAARVDRALEWLSNRSLLTFSLDGQTIVVHRLVARAIRDELARRHRLAAVCWTAASVLEARAVALAESRDRPAVRSIPQQVTALLKSVAGLAGEADEDLVEILLRLRFISLYHLIELGDSTSEAIAIGEAVIADFEQWLGPDHPDTLNARNSLAAAYLSAGQAAEAIPLFELTLEARERLLGPDDPDTLTSQNNLAAAYQDAGRPAEAVQLYELSLAARERLLGPNHLSTLNSRGNLATAYRDAGRIAEAIPLFEQTLADRERLLGPDHPDTRTSRKNLATAYRDEGRVAEAIPLFEQDSTGRERIVRPSRSGSRALRRNLATGHRDAKAFRGVERTSAAPDGHPPAGTAGQTGPAGLRRPPAGPARRALPAGLRRPPADPARQAPPDGAVPPSAGLADSASRAPGPQRIDAEYDRKVVAALAAGDPAGVAMAYDRYAAALYGYCHWMLHDTAATTGALQDTFVIAVGAVSELTEPSHLRPWLFALARSECRRRTRTTPARRDEKVGAANQYAPAGRPADATGGVSADATVQFRAVGRPVDATGGVSADATVQFRAVGQRASAAHVSTDVTMPMRAVGRTAAAANGVANFEGDPGRAHLRTLIRSILADLKPREREAIELSFRHNLDNDDLAIALAVSSSRAHLLASRAHGRLWEAIGTLHVAFTRRRACSALGELLVDWDGRLTEETLDLVGWHIEQCLSCADHGRGTLRPEAFSRLLPLAPLPAELRDQVLDRCSATTEDAAAYRRQVTRRAESTWRAVFSQAIRWVSWENVRANPGVTIAAAAVTLWVVAALSIMLFTFAGSHAAHADAAAPTAGTSSSRPASAAPAPAGAGSAGPTSAAARSSSAIRRPRASVPFPGWQSPTPSPVFRLSSSATGAPSSQSSKSSSPSPSQSPKASKSPSPSPSPSGTTSPSPSPSASPSPSP
jgi:RNA polymerase sigma factor (sigma-70 family)